MKSGFRILTYTALAVFCAMTALTLSVTLPAKADDTDVTQGVAYLAALEQVTPAQAEKTIRDARAAREETAAPTAEVTVDGSPEDADSLPVQQETKPDLSKYTEKQREILEAIDEGNFDYAFRDILVVGDSLVKGLTEFEVLDPSYVISEIGGGTIYLNEIFYDIVNANPRWLVIHIGENELDTESYCEYFIYEYQEVIEELQDWLPDTEIYVESIFPVLDHALEDEPYLANIDYYNDHIREMAQELGVHYVDYDPVFASFPRSYYELDGIHQLPEFYTEQYMPHILKEVYQID